MSFSCTVYSLWFSLSWWTGWLKLLLKSLLTVLCSAASQPGWRPDTLSEIILDVTSCRCFWSVRTRLVSNAATGPFNQSDKPVVKLAFAGCCWSLPFLNWNIFVTECSFRGQTNQRFLTLKGCVVIDPVVDSQSSSLNWKQLRDSWSQTASRVSWSNLLLPDRGVRPNTVSWFKKSYLIIRQ